MSELGKLRRRYFSTVGLLSASDKLYIARNEGTEFKKPFRAQGKVIELNQPT
jgi:hypothetical protein